MTSPTTGAPAAEEVPATDPQVSSADPQPVASTLGQTPHEPAVRPWELELLISGALVFAMLQLPGQLDAWFHGLEPRLDTGGFFVVFLVWYYVKLAVYALAGGFALHLAVRGYWVGVIGLEAVFPRGIAWEKARGGPILRELQRNSTPPLQTLIDRADRLASMIFAAAFMLALMLFSSLFIGGLALAVSYVIASLFFTPARATLVMQFVIFFVIAPLFIVSFLDKRLGERLEPGSLGARAIRRVGRSYVRVQRFAPFGPLMLTLVTNLRGRRGVRTATILLIVGGLAFFMKEMLMEAAGVHTDGYAYLPDAPGALGVDQAFYDDQREDGVDYSEYPSIQSDMVRDPYVRLFIPYRPRRHNDLIRRRCPEVRAAVAGGGIFGGRRPAGDAAGRAVLACMAALQPVTLDGHPIVPAWRFHADPRTGLRGMVAYLPVAGLPKGENLLTVARTPLIDPSPSEARKPRPPYAIPFWL